MTRISRRIARWLTGTLVFALVAGTWGCTPGVLRTAPAGGRPAERSADRRPEWITRLPQDKDHFFATGFATGAASLEEGRAAAVQAAVQEIVNYLGLRAQVSYSETRTELSTRLVNRITSEGFAQVAKGRPVEMYYERSQVPGEREPGHRFDVYVLLRIPQVVLDGEEKRLKLDRQRRIGLAGTLLREGRTYSEAGDAGAALRRWLEAGRLLEGEWGVDEPRQEIKTAMSDLASSIVLTADERKDPSAGGTGPWKVRAVMRRGAVEKPLPWFPLMVRFRAGGVTREEAATTDKEGEALVALPPGIGDPSRAAAWAAIDADRLLSLGEGGPPPGGDLHSGMGSLRSTALWLHRPADKAGTVAGPSLRPESAATPVARSGPSPEGGPDAREEPPPDVHPEEAGPLRVRITPDRTMAYVDAPPGDLSVGYLVDIRARPSFSPRRPPLNLALVVDRSGSMAEAGKMEYVKEAIRLVLENMGPRDRLSVVVYSDEADVLLSGGTSHDRFLIEHHLEMLEPTGTTNLSAGLFEGVKLAETFFQEGGINRVVLLSDGLANRGVVSRGELARYAGMVGKDGVSLSTIGVGKEFDEDLLEAIASAGQGKYYYVGDPERIPAVFREEMQGLVSVVAQNISMTITLEGGVEIADVFGFPYEKTGNTVRIRFGDIASGGRTLAGVRLRLPQGSEGTREIGAAAVEYDQVAGGIGRVTDRFPLRVDYTGDRGKAESRRNSRVDRYLQVLTTMDVMSLAMRSRDSALTRETLGYLENRLKSFREWSRTADDPEMASLAAVFDRCVEELRQGTMGGHRGSSSPDGDSARKIRYRLYRLLRYGTHR